MNWHHKVQKFFSGNGSPGWSQKKGRKLLWCGVVLHELLFGHIADIQYLRMFVIVCFSYVC